MPNDHMHFVALLVVSPFKEKKRKMQKRDRGRREMERETRKHLECLSKGKGLMKHGKPYEMIRCGHVKE